VKSRNRVIVTALREIAAGKVSAVMNESSQGDSDLPPMSN
jgi:hypothetical protein